MMPGRRSNGETGNRTNPKYIRHMTRFIGVLAISTLLLPASSFAASKEQEEMQRDIAQLQDQVRTLQSSFDTKLATMQTLLQQALDGLGKANTTVSVLSASVTQTLDRELKDALLPVAGMSAKVDNNHNDLSDLKNSIGDLTAQINRLQTSLNDVSTQVKLCQAPVAAPPPPTGTDTQGNTPVPGSPAAARIPPAKALYDNANSDYFSGKSDLAAAEYADFLKYYPDDPNAPEAQFNIGQIHLSQQKYDQAVMDFDAVLERYPDTKITPDAYFMKGMALLQGKHNTAAAKEFRAVVAKYPRSDAAPKAKEQLRAMGLSTSTTSRKR